MNDTSTPDWPALSARASLASHRLIGWIYWDPIAKERYAALGPDPFSYYVASRCAPLLPAGHQAVTAACYSINPSLIEVCVEAALAQTTPAAITAARDEAVGIGLRTYVPEIVDDLAAMADGLWLAADSLPASGRVLFAAHRQLPRPEDTAVSAWVAANCMREWRGDTHWAVLAAEGIDGVAAGVLHDAFLDYGGWIARSRGADEAAVELAFAQLADRGLVTDGRVNAEGVALREAIEDRTDRLCERAWRHLGEDGTRRFLDLVEPFGPTFLARIDETAGPQWMPAARDRKRA